MLKSLRATTVGALVLQLACAGPIVAQVVVGPDGRVIAPVTIESYASSYDAEYALIHGQALSVYDSVASVIKERGADERHFVILADGYSPARLTLDALTHPESIVLHPSTPAEVSCVGCGPGDELFAYCNGIYHRSAVTNSLFDVAIGGLSCYLHIRIPGGYASSDVVEVEFSSDRTTTLYKYDSSIRGLVAPELLSASNLEVCLQRASEPVIERCTFPDVDGRFVFQAIAPRRWKVFVQPMSPEVSVLALVRSGEVVDVVLGEGMGN